MQTYYLINLLWLVPTVIGTGTILTFAIYGFIKFTDKN